MITVTLMGGLGNQLFQIAATMAYSIDNKKAFWFPYSEKLMVGIERPTYWTNLLKALSPFTKTMDTYPQMIREIGFEYRPFPKGADNVTLFGYFQSYRYFHHQFQNIRKLIKLDTLIEQIKHRYSSYLSDKTVSLHFRLGDYKWKQDHHPVLPLTYYEGALKTLESRVNTVLVFGEQDDDLIVKQNIRQLQEAFPALQFIQASHSMSDWEQLLLMSCCQHSIIANSSFSWWAAYIGQQYHGPVNHLVCYPSKWFGPAMGSKNLGDLFCPDWQKVQV